MFVIAVVFVARLSQKLGGNATSSGSDRPRLEYRIALLGCQAHLATIEANLVEIKLGNHIRNPGILPQRTTRGPLESDMASPAFHLPRGNHEIVMQLLKLFSQLQRAVGPVAVTMFVDLLPR
jgi:hypothetical protein